jgi:hypothetical protein
VGAKQFDAHQHFLGPLSWCCQTRLHCCHHGLGGIPWDSSHLFLVPRIQQRSFGHVNKHVEFIGQFKEIPWGRTHSPLVPFVLYYSPPFVRSLKTNSDDGMDPPPKCERHSGFGTKLNTCVGCEGYITPGDHSHFCLFREIEYELDGTFFSPCENQYHPEFIKVGKTFKTRLVRSTLGLQYPPPAMTHFPFICEACTVRAVLGRELTWTSGHMQLLMLKRMRLIDMAHAWASSNLQGTARYLGRLSNFGQKYGIELVPKAPITHPLRSAVIPLLWGVLEYTLQTSPKTGEGIEYNTARSLQSVASAYHLWEKNAPIPRSYVPG